MGGCSNHYVQKNMILISKTSSFPAVDLLYGNIYCFLCSTYVYDDEIDVIARDESDKISWIKGSFFCCKLLLEFTIFRVYSLTHLKSRKSSVFRRIQRNSSLKEECIVFE